MKCTDTRVPQMIKPDFGDPCYPDATIVDVGDELSKQLLEEFMELATQTV